MQAVHVPVQIVHSRVVHYQPSFIDLRWSKAIHSCDVCPFLGASARGLVTGRAVTDGAACGAVHYGVCTPVRGSVPFRSSSAVSQGKAPPLPAKKRKITVPIMIKGANGAATVVSNKPSVSVLSLSGADDVQQQGSATSIPITVTKSRTDIQITPVSPVEPIKPSRNEPEEDSFLRQKEAELKLRRERERQADKDKENISAAAFKPSPVSTTLTPVKPTSPSIPSTTLNITPTEIITDVLQAVPSVKKPDVVVKSEPSTDRTPQKSLIASTTTEKTPASTTPVSKPVSADKFQPSPDVIVVPHATITPPVSQTKTPTVRPLQASNIPQFHFPLGRPAPEPIDSVLDSMERRMKVAFESFPDGKALKQNMAQLAKICDLPLYWKLPLFNYLGGDKAGFVTLSVLETAYKKLMKECHDEASKFLRIVSRTGNPWLTYDDFLPLIQDVVDTHPGLTFLLEAPEFHSRYIQTVISRIFYCVNSSWTERITLQELRKSKLLQTMRLLEQEDDINQITDCFSYEHFYVIYCKFWELDKDHDLLISKEDLGRHNDHAISSRMIDRVFSGAVTRKLVDGKLSYKDFVWFLISEEDKKHPRSIEYWFRCMDLDGDGVISMYEMEYFYEEQVEKMEMLGIETLPFQDCLCQMLDMIRPVENGRIRLRDLKTCALSPIFFDTFFNLDKYLEHEQKDPFASLREGEEAEMSDWERYAAEEYELLVAEEGASELQQQEDVVYDDDFEADDQQDSSASSGDTSKSPAALKSPSSPNTASVAAASS